MNDWHWYGTACAFNQIELIQLNIKFIWCDWYPYFYSHCSNIIESIVCVLWYIWNRTNWNKMTKFMRQKCYSVHLGIASKWKWIIRLLFGQSDGIDINKYELEQYNIPLNNSFNYLHSETDKKVLNPNKTNEDDLKLFHLYQKYVLFGYKILYVTIVQQLNVNTKNMHVHTIECRCVHKCFIFNIYTMHSIEMMTFIWGKRAIFAPCVCDLERNSNHTIYKYMWQDEWEKN